jgi:hypothetical protein
VFVKKSRCNSSCSDTVLCQTLCCTCRLGGGLSKLCLSRKADVTAAAQLLSCAERCAAPAGWELGMSPALMRAIEESGRKPNVIVSDIVTMVGMPVVGLFLFSHSCRFTARD